MVTKHRAQDSKQKDKQTRQSRRRPRLAFRLLAAFLSPLVFLLSLEIVLRLVGYGQAGTFFIPWTSAGRTVYLANPHYCEHFVPKELSRSPEWSVLEEKGPATLRIFVLGGSAAYGDPDAAYGFCRLLEVLLNAHGQGTSFEVVNAAVTSMNSHVARRIAADCAAHDPDVFLVYMGNNEVVGPFGPPTLPASLYDSRAFIDLCIWARKETRLGRLITRTAEAVRSSHGQQKRWMGMEAFLTNQIAADDPRLVSCYRHFGANLRDIAQTAQGAGAATVLCTVPTNLRSCAPFGSAHGTAFDRAREHEWNRLFAEGRELERTGDIKGALQRYEAAGRLDASYANLAFCQGRCFLALDQITEAQRLFTAARDLDTLRFRADSPINEMIRRTAADLADNGVTLCDLEGALSLRAKANLPGSRLMADHVHLNFRGNYLAAMAAMEAIGRALPQAKLATPTASEDELFSLCRNRLLYGRAEAYHLGMVMYRRKTLPPFAGQIDHDAELARLRQDLLTVYSVIKGQEEPESWYAEAVKQAPLDPYLNVRYGEYLLGQGRVRDAVRHYQETLAAQPASRMVREGLAQALARAGAEAQAVELLTEADAPYSLTRREALLMLGTYYVTHGQLAQATGVYRELEKITPDDVDVLVNLAAAAAHAQDAEAVKRYMDRALKLAPDSAQARINMGNYYAKQNQPDEAQKWFAEAVKLAPYDYLAHIGLGIQSIRLGQIEKGLGHVRKAVILKPDFAEGYEILAAAYEQAGQADQAKAYGALRDLFRAAPARQTTDN